MSGWSSQLKVVLLLCAASASIAAPQLPEGSGWRAELARRPRAHLLASGSAGGGGFDANALPRASRRKEVVVETSASGTVLQIVNNVAGAGILALSAGMAGGVGSVPAMILCLGLGVISGFTFYLIGSACEMTGQTTFKGLWASTLGPSSAWLVDAAVALMCDTLALALTLVLALALALTLTLTLTLTRCLSAAIIYSGILGDTSTQLLTLAGVPNFANRRTTNIVGLTVSALLPLSLLNDLSALAFTSLLGCVAVLYTAFFVFVRALDGSYAVPADAVPAQASAAIGRFAVALAPEMLPSFAKASPAPSPLTLHPHPHPQPHAHLYPHAHQASRWRLDANALVLSSNLGLAYIAHYNAPAFYK